MVKRNAVRSFFRVAMILGSLLSASAALAQKTAPAPPPKVAVPAAATVGIASIEQLTHADLISLMRGHSLADQRPPAPIVEPPPPVTVGLNGLEPFPPVPDRMAFEWRANDLGNRLVTDYNETGRAFRESIVGSSLADKINFRISSRPELRFKVDFD